MRYNTKQMVNEIHKELNELVTKGVINRVLKAKNDIVKDALLKDNSVVLQGLGTFSLIDIAKRNYRNLQTGGVISKPKTKRLKFTFSPTFCKVISATHSK